MSRRRRWCTVAVLLAAGVCGAAARATQNGPDSESSLRITSPRGRTGAVSRVRIVAQLRVPPGTVLSPVSFWVDGRLVGTVENGPPYAIEWTDDNPFERREIVVQAAEGAGRVLRDSVVLPPFEITDKTDVTSILLEAGVYDKTGRFISQLDAASFSVTENGVAQKIDQVARETIPTTLLLLVDNSQSMSRRMEFVRHAAERLGTALRARDQVIVAPFNGHIGAITGPTNDRATIAEAIGAMRAGGGTAILDALGECTKLLQQLDGRRAVVLITDGYDEHSTSSMEAVLKSAETAQTTVYVIGVGGVAGISLKGESMLRRLADQTGGRIFFPPRESDLGGVAESVATDSHNRYLIAFTPANQKRDGSWREVSVKVPEGYRVRTRAGYFAPNPPPIRPALEFTVTNEAHEYIEVAPEQLEVLEDGVVQSLDTFQEAVDPVSIVMALDASGSMKKSADALRQTARDFVLAVRPEDSLALIMFSDTPLFAHTLALNRQWTLDAIDKYVANGGTALYDALWNSLTHLKGVPGRHAVVVLTDGRDEDNPGTGPGSTHELDQVVQLGHTVGATIFPIGLGPKVERHVLDRLASESGGQSYYASDSAQLGDQFRRIVENLRRRYVLSYTSTNGTHDGEWRSVVIRPRSGRFSVASLGGYFAPDR